MSDTLSTPEIKKRSIKGAKWLLMMNGMGMPAAFLIALMLGRVGSAALGDYALAQILIGFITTFIVYGGAPVLSVFIPKFSYAVDRGRFFFSYVLILLGMMTVTLGLFWLFPKAFEFLMQREFDMQNYGWFVLLAIVVVLAETIANTASSLILIKAAAIARQMMRLVLLPLVAVLFFFKREILIDHGMPCILGGFLAGYILAAVICVISIAHDQRLKMHFGWLLPHGFWALSLSVMMSTIFTFLYSNFDRMAVLSINDVEGLGMYQAVLSLSMLIGLVPKMLGTTLVPMFSSLLATGKTDAIRKAYHVLQRTGSIVMTGAALFLISYSSELLALFGESYSAYDYLLALFCIQAVITSLHFGNTPILIAYEKNLFRLGVSALQIIIQIALTLIFITHFGVIAIASAKVTGVIFANVLIIFYVINRLGNDFVIPLSYKAGVFVALVCAIVRIYFLPDDWLSSTVLFFISVGCFFIGSKITIEEIKGILDLVFSRKFSSKLKIGH